MPALRVALQEGADALFQVALDIVEASLGELVLARTKPPHDPLGAGEPLHAGEEPDRLRKRALRIGLEAASVWLAAAGNHLVNAHLRLAWEGNAAARDDIVACGFDPDSNRFDNWADVDGMRRGIDKVRQRPLAVLPHFALQPGRPRNSRAEASSARYPSTHTTTSGPARTAAPRPLATQEASVSRQARHTPGSDDWGRSPEFAMSRRSLARGNGTLVVAGPAGRWMGAA
jgi:hypothetical protein